MYIYIYIYTYTQCAKNRMACVRRKQLCDELPGTCPSIYLSIYLSMFIYLSMCIYMCMYVYIYIYRLVNQFFRDPWILSPPPTMRSGLLRPARIIVRSISEISSYFHRIIVRSIPGIHAASHYVNQPHTHTHTHTHLSFSL